MQIDAIRTRGKRCTDARAPGDVYAVLPGQQREREFSIFRLERDRRAVHGYVRHVRVVGQGDRLLPSPRASILELQLVLGAVPSKIDGLRDAVDRERAAGDGRGAGHLERQDLTDSRVILEDP